MWILRFLNGPLAGQTMPLNKSSTLIGRAPNCDIKVPSSNVSKEHTRIELFDDKLIISDAGSRNGTFINGTKIRSSKAKSGDKVAIHDIFFEIQKVPEAWAARFQNGFQNGYPSGYPNYPAPGFAGQPPPPYPPGNVAYQAHYAPQPGAQGAQALAEDIPPQNFTLQDFLQNKLPMYIQLLQTYIERVILPGVYKLPEMFDFKWVLAGMMAGFIILVTALSTVPLTRILKASIEEESQHHAMTIATTLARVNIPALSQGIDTGVSVEIATSRPGVDKAYIISNVDGNVIAPATQAGNYSDLPYVNEGRKLDKESVKQVSDNTIIAMYPVRFYNSDTGTQAITAWAVVMFDMSSLAIDNSQVLSLFITTLFIALMVGLVLFYFLYKIVEHPINDMNLQLDQALKEGQETVQVNYRFPAMQLLASNVSSALSRAINGSNQSAASGAGKGLEHDRNREIANLIELIGFAAMGVRAADLTIAAVNQAFEARIGMNSTQLSTLTLNELSDQSLKLSVKDLIERLDQSPDELASNDLEFSGNNFQVVAQAIFGTNKIAYYLIVLLPKSEEG